MQNMKPAVWNPALTVVSSDSPRLITSGDSVFQHIKIATPRDDVCAVCETIRKEIMDASSEDEKLATTSNDARPY